MRAHLAEMIRRDLKDPRLSDVPVVSVNIVELNRDMSVARVFVGFPGAARREAEAATRALRAGAGRLRGPLGRRMNLARAPELRFDIDTSQEFGHRLTEIVREDARRGGADEYAEESASEAGAGEGAGGEGGEGPRGESASRGGGESAPGDGGGEAGRDG